jgi:hypothetical protein
MRFESATVLFAIAAMPAALMGQSASGTVAATATVQSAVAFQTPVRNLDLGIMTPGAAVTITPANGGVIGIQYNTPATVTVGTLLMTGPGGATFSPTLSCAQAGTSNAANPAAFTCGTGYVTALATNAASTWYTYVGATVSAGATTSAPAGDYTGTVTLTATFSTF